MFSGVRLEKKLEDEARNTFEKLEMRTLTFTVELLS